MDGDTIVALGTPPGSSGIAVIRISGPGAVELLERLVPGAGAWDPRTIHTCTPRDASGEPIDEAVAVVMRAPHSYTGEDCAEISCHGSMAVAARVIEEAVRCGARPAGPGEFTRRAFLSGRIDLAQAEAVADLIAAETRLQARVALEHLSGHLSQRVEMIEKELLGLLAGVEAAIDFSTEDIEIFTNAGVLRTSRGIRARIEALLETEAAGARLRAGVRVVIAGPRNAGKSSLYNALIGEERAIVSPVPGTTRDVLRERIHIGGFPCWLEDTAGLDEAQCQIEAQGILKGREAAGTADLVVFVIDGAAGWSERVESEYALIAASNHIIVLSKCDLGLAEGLEKRCRRTRPGRLLVASAATGAGLVRLREMLYESTVRGEAGEIGRERVALNERQAGALREARKALERLECEAKKESPAEILSVEIREALDACAQVTGRTATPDLLDEIFGRFCIGK